MKKTAFIVLILFSFGCKKDKPEPEPLPPVTSVGEFYQGGLVFYVDSSGQHGYIITDRDIDTCSWTNATSPSDPTPSVMGSALSSGYGPANDAGRGEIYTEKIVQMLGNGHYAAKVCHELELNGYSDWYLPSCGEMYLVNRSEIFPWSSADDNPAQGDYWTSSERYDADSHSCCVYMARAFRWPVKQDFWTYNKKILNGKVRAIRRF